MSSMLKGTSQIWKTKLARFSVKIDFIRFFGEKGEVLVFFLKLASTSKRHGFDTKTDASYVNPRRI